MKILQKINQYKADAGGFKNLFFHTALAITFTSGLSYMLGLIRDKSFAYTFGASSTLDVYNAAFVVPDLFLATLVNGALSAAFIPIFANLEKHHKQKALEYINQVLSFGMSILIAASVLFAIFLPYLVEFIVPGFSAAQQDQYITVTRLMLISPLLFTISNTFGNVLISTKDFLWYGLSPVFYNLGIIIGVFLFVPSFGIMGLVMGTVLGAFLHLMVRLPVVIRYGYRPKLTFKLEGELKKTATLMLPKMLQLGMWQIMLWWFIRLASHLEEGSVTIYSFARNFQSLPVSLIGVAIALAAFAKLS
ncbi:MAG: integral membrane protein MviN, partial [uncultured bacterium]